MALYLTISLWVIRRCPGSFYVPKGAHFSHEFAAEIGFLVFMQGIGGPKLQNPIPKRKPLPHPPLFLLREGQ